MNNPSKLVRLSEINHGLDSIVNFAYDQENKPSLTDAALKGVAIGTGIGGATLAHKAISSSGGYGANWAAGKAAFGRGVAGTGLQGITKGPGRAVGQGLGMALAKLKTILPNLKLNSKEKEVRLDEHILEPFSEGAVPNSTIIQEQFPADLAPAAVLKFPFPKLMAFLKQKNILQQQFSKRERLVQLNAKVDKLIEFADPKDIDPLTGNIYSDGGALYVRAADVGKDRDILKYPHLRHGQYIKIIDRNGRPTYESRKSAKVMDSIGGGILGSSAGALAQLAITRRPHVAIGAIGGGLTGAGAGYLIGKHRTLPQDKPR